MKRTLTALVLLNAGIAAAQSPSTQAPTAPSTATYTGPQAVLYLSPMACSGGTCGNNAGSEFEAALTQALQNSGYFRVVKREDIANLAISGGVTNIDGGNSAGFLFFAQSKVKVKAAIQVSDPSSGELIFTQQCEGDSTTTAVSIMGFTAGEKSGYGKAAADCAARLTEAITASNRIQPFLKFTPGSALPAARNVPTQATVPLPLASTPTPPSSSVGAISSEQVNNVVRMLEGTVKGLSFNDLNSLFTSDVLNPVKIKELNAAASSETLQAASKMTFKVASVENVGIMQIIGLSYTLPDGQEKFIQLGMVGEGQLNSRGGTRILYMSAFNPMRAAMPQFELISRGTETFLNDVLTGLKLAKP